MFDFKAKVHQIQFRLGELTALPRPPSWIKGGLLLREGERKRGEGEGKEGEGKGSKGKEERGGKG